MTDKAPQAEVKKEETTKPQAKKGRKQQGGEGEEEQTSNKVQYLGPDLTGETTFFGATFAQPLMTHLFTLPIYQVEKLMLE